MIVWYHGNRPLYRHMIEMNKISVRVEEFLSLFLRSHSIDLLESVVSFFQIASKRKDELCVFERTEAWLAHSLRLIVTRHNLVACCFLLFFFVCAQSAFSSKYLLFAEYFPHFSSSTSSFRRGFDSMASTLFSSKSSSSKTASARTTGATGNGTPITEEELLARGAPITSSDVLRLTKATKSDVTLVIRRKQLGLGFEF